MLIPIAANTTLTVGSRTLGPFTDSNFTQAVFIIDRTVAGGFNSLDQTSTVQISITVDGVFNAGTTFFGGVFKDHSGNIITQSELTVNGLFPGAQVTVQTVTAGPSSVVVGGGTSSLTLT